MYLLMLRWLWDISSLDVTLKSSQHHSSSGGSSREPHEPGMTNEIAIYPSIRSNEGQTIKGTILVRAVESVTLRELISEICIPSK